MVGERWFRVNNWLKIFESNGRLVAIEQTESSQMLAELALDTNLDQITLEQNSVVLADKPHTSDSHQRITSAYIHTKCTNCWVAAIKTFHLHTDQILKLS